MARKVLFKSALEDFKAAARQKRFTVREFVFSVAKFAQPRSDAAGGASTPFLLHRLT